MLGSIEILIEDERRAYSSRREKVMEMANNIIFCSRWSFCYSDCRRVVGAGIADDEDQMDSRLDCGVG